MVTEQDIAALCLAIYPGQPPVQWDHLNCQRMASHLDLKYSRTKPPTGLARCAVVSNRFQSVPLVACPSSPRSWLTGAEIIAEDRRDSRLSFRRYFLHSVSTHFPFWVQLELS